MAFSPEQKTKWTVYSVIVIAGLLVVFLNFSNQFSSSSSEHIDRAALAKKAPKMTNKAYHRNFKSFDQCITCHTQRVLNAPLMPHEPRAQCTDCHKVAA